MDVAERQVPPDVPHVGEVGEELADDRLGLPAVRALEVAVLDDGDGRVDRPANVIPLRVDVDVEVDDRLRRAEQRADPQPPREERGGRNTVQVTVAAARAALRMPNFASSSACPSTATVATSNATVNPMPAIVPPPASAPHPTGGRSLPRLTRVSSQEKAEDADRLAEDVAEEDPERDQRGEGAAEEGGVDRDPRVREGEQRHDHVARPRMERLLQTLVDGRRGPSSRRAARASSAVGCSRNSRNRSVARSRLARGAGEA